MGFNRPQLRNVSFNTSNQYTSWTSKPDSSCTVRDVVPSRFTAPFTSADRRYEIWISWSRCLYEEVSAIASWSTVAALVDHRFEVQLLTLSVDVRTQCTRARATASCGLFIPGLDHQKMVALITLHYRQCSTQSHGLHTIPSPVASNNAACPRWKIANQGSESTTGCGHPRGGRRACSIASSALVPTAFALLWSPEPLASRHIHPPWKCNVYRKWVRNARLLNKLSCAPQRGFFEASADCDELECDVAWLVTALQRVVSDLVVKPI
ncbi:unnamed protein product [Penicillium nalgiovense]|nr:unnamed protein product [Penicillium nalgiovense]